MIHSIAEVIQETSYDGRADVWSMGITAIEISEGMSTARSVRNARVFIIL
jgi:hypothetical protein